MEEKINEVRQKPKKEEWKKGGRGRGMKKIRGMKREDKKDGRKQSTCRRMDKGWRDEEKMKKEVKREGRTEESYLKRIREEPERCTRGKLGRKGRWKEGGRWETLKKVKVKE